MKRTRLLGLALVATLALAAGGATAAQAAVPFYKVGGAALGAGVKKTIKTAKQTKNYVLKTTAGPEITCTENSVETGANLEGTASGTQTILFKGCTVAGNGAGCTVKSPAAGEIKTNTVKTKLVTGKTKSTGTIDVLFTPVTAGEFVNIKFTGASCKVKEAKVTGNVAAEAESAAGPVIVGAEPAEAITGFVNFPATQIKAVFNGEEEIKVGLLFAEGASELIGRTEIKLEKEEKWGVFTK